MKLLMLLVHEKGFIVTYTQQYNLMVQDSDILIEMCVVVY